MIAIGQHSRLSTAVWGVLVCCLWAWFFLYSPGKQNEPKFDGATPNAAISNAPTSTAAGSDAPKPDAINHIVDGDQRNAWHINHLRYIFEDRETKTLQTIMNLPAQEWHYLNGHNPNLGVLSDAVWFHGKLEFDDDFSGYLQIDRPYLNYISAFFVQQGKLLDEFYTGDKFEFAQRPVIHTTFLFPLSVAAGSTIDLYLRVDSGTTPLNFQATLFNQQAFVHNNQIRSIVHTIYFGGIIIITLYNLFLYFSLREMAYLFYVVASSTMGLVCATYLGYSYEFLWPNSPELNQLIVPALTPVFRISTALFILNFLNLKKNFPWFYRIILLFVIIDPAILVMKSIVASLFLYQASYYITLLFYPALLITTYFLALQGLREARYISIGWTLFTIGGLSYMRELYGGREYDIFNIELMLYGHLAETVLFAFALADRINIARKKEEEAGLLYQKSAQNAEELLKARTELMQSQIDKVEIEQLANQARIESKAKSEFLASVSHEIRTPMNGVIGITDLLRDTGLNDVQRKYVDIIQESGQSLLTIINDVLDYSTIEAGKMPIEQIDFDLEELINECTSLISLQCLQKQLQLVTCIGPGVPQTMKGDPNRLRQVLMNLFSNAIRSTEEGEITLKVTFEPFNLVEHALRFQICDTGIGLTTEQQSEIFQSFKQTVPTPSGNYNSTGIGLNISAQLIKLMGGKIGLQSEPGKGTCVSILIPFTAASTDIIATTPLYKQDLKGKRLLIVDESRTFREFTQLQAEGWGMIVDNTDSGSKALSKLYNAEQTDKPFDLVMTSITLPNLDTGSLAKTIRFDNGLSVKPAVLLSSTSRFQPPDATEQGENQYHHGELLEKPVLSSDLRKRFVDALGEKQIDTQRAPASNHDLRLDLNILVVEDNQTNRIVARGQLEKLGLKADFAENGEQAIALVETHQPYDLIFMDINMPSLDGFAASQRIRAYEKQQHQTPAVIVALTAHIGKEIREKSEAVGMNGFLSKPILIDALKDTVIKYFGEVKLNS